MPHQFRLLTDEMQRKQLQAQLLQAEIDMFQHKINADMAKVSGDKNIEGQQKALAEAAEARAVKAAAMLDDLPEVPADES